MQLAQHGKLALTDKLTRWFPEAPADKRAITVAQLLDRTAGFEEYAGGDFGGETPVSFAARGQRFSPNGAVGLAGSDMTHFFLYERDPQKGTSIIIATNNAAFMGPKARLPIEIALGNIRAIPPGPR